MESDGFINLLVNLLASPNVMRSKPATDSFSLEIGMKPFGKFMIGSGVADEKRVVFDGRADQRLGVSDKGLWHASATQEYFWDVAVRAKECVPRYRRWN